MLKMHQNTFTGQALPLCLDPPGELKHSPRPSSRNQGILLLMALKEVTLCRFGPLKFDAWSALGERTVLYKNIVLSFCF